MTIYELIDSGIEKANGLPQLKNNGLVISLEVNEFSKKVSLMVNNEVALSVKCKTMDEGYVCLFKWLLAGSMPIFKDVNVFDIDDTVKVISNDGREE